MFFSQEHQQHGQAYKKNTGEDFFAVDFFPGRLFHLISLPQRSQRGVAAIEENALNALKCLKCLKFTERLYKI